MRIRWTVQSLIDRESIFEYSKDFSPQAAVRADDQIELQVDKLEDFPRMGRPGRFADTRELVIHHTRCVVVYRLTETDVVVERVLYGSQKWPETLD